MRNIVKTSVSKGYSQNLQDPKLNIMEETCIEFQKKERHGSQKIIGKLLKIQQELESHIVDYEQELYEKDRQIDLLKAEKLAWDSYLKPIRKNAREWYK